MGYEKKDWNLSGGVLADSFTFTVRTAMITLVKRSSRKNVGYRQLNFIERFDWRLYALAATRRS